MNVRRVCRSHVSKVFALTPWTRIYLKKETCEGGRVHESGGSMRFSIVEGSLSSAMALLLQDDELDQHAGLAMALCVTKGGPHPCVVYD